MAELADRVYLDRGEVAAKQSRFWVLLCLAGVIATAGVVTDAGVAVIGAMIIAPLGTPILAIALAITEGSLRRAARSFGLTLLGIAAVVGLGAAMAAVLPTTVPLVENAQVTGRTSPGLVDLLIATATGIAAALGTARRDVADVLPGVALSISLVPPLAVVGVAAEEGQGALALGALLLFATNLVALVAAGSLIFDAFGYASEARAPTAAESEQLRRRGRALVAVSVLVVAATLAAETVYEIALNRELGRVTTAARAWIATIPGAQLRSVTREGRGYVIAVEAPQGATSPSLLLQRLHGELPSGTTVILEHLYGKRSEIGKVP